MNVFFVSDLHLGHKTVMQHTHKHAHEGAYRGPDSHATTEEHDEWVVERMLSVDPHYKRTLWWVLGDVAMEARRLKLLDTVPGRKRLVLGNHDKFHARTYLRHFESVHGTERHYDMWISHVPIHPLELFGHVNIHGHSHAHPLRDWPEYFNACIEWLPSGKPVSLDEVRDEFKRRGL